MTDSAVTTATVTFTPIGTIRSDHRAADTTPIQPVFARGCRGRAEILPAYAAGLADLEAFSHVILLYVFDRAGAMRLTVEPFLEAATHGIFATRHPARPNPLGLSVVRLEKIEGTILHLDDVDILDGTPLLDVKPYVPRFDQVADARGGWTDGIDEATASRRGRRGFQGGGAP
jgi:tRNA-Thr(GGU) m(6)t(6)A37 methyltransferase TsaA